MQCFNVKGRERGQASNLEFQLISSYPSNSCITDFKEKSVIQELLVKTCIC